MRAALSAQPAQARAVAFGPFVFDRVAGLLRANGADVALPPRVLGVLVLLLERAGDVVTKQELMAAVWRDAYVTETSLAEAISVLRQTLGDDPQRPTYIQTLHRRGYRFIAAVLDADEAAPAAAAPPAAAGPAEVGSVDTTAPSAAAEPDPRLGLLVPWIVAAVAVATAAAAVWQYVNAVAPPQPSPVRFAIALPPGLTVAPGGAPAAIAGDGSLVAFAGCDSAQCAIYLRPLSQTEATAVAGTSGGAAPFFSPDGRSLGFFANRRLLTLALGGGAPVVVAEASEPLGAAWLRDGQIVFARAAADGLFITTPGSGVVRPLTAPAAGEGGHRWPAALPDGTGVVFSVVADPSRPDRLYGATALLRTGGWGRVLDDVGGVGVPSREHLVGQRAGGLVASAFDPRTRSVIGLPIAVPSPPLAPGPPRFAVDGAGTLLTVAPAGDVLHVVLHWTADLRRLVPPPPPALPR